MSRLASRYARRGAACAVVLALLCITNSAPAADAPMPADDPMRLLVVPPTAAGPVLKADAKDHARIAAALDGALRDDLPDARLDVKFANPSPDNPLPMRSATAATLAQFGRVFDVRYVLVGGYVLRGKSVHVAFRFADADTKQFAGAVGVDGKLDDLDSLRKQLVDDLRWQLDVADNTAPDAPAAPPKPWRPGDPMYHDGNLDMRTYRPHPDPEGLAADAAARQQMATDFYDPSRFADIFDPASYDNTMAGGGAGNPAGRAGGNAMRGGPTNSMGGGNGRGGGGYGGNFINGGDGNFAKGPSHTMGPVDPHVMIWGPGNVMTSGPGNHMTNTPGYQNRGGAGNTARGPGNAARGGTGNAARGPGNTARSGGERR